MSGWDRSIARAPITNVPSASQRARSVIRRARTHDASWTHCPLRAVRGATRLPLTPDAQVEIDIRIRFAGAVSRQARVRSDSRARGPGPQAGSAAGWPVDRAHARCHAVAL